MEESRSSSNQEGSQSSVAALPSNSSAQVGAVPMSATRPRTKGVGVLVSPPGATASKGPPSEDKVPLHPASKAAAVKRGQDAMNVSLDVVGALPPAPPSRRIPAANSRSLEQTQTKSRAAAPNSPPQPRKTQSTATNGTFRTIRDTHDAQEDEDSDQEDLAGPDAPGAHSMAPSTPATAVLRQTSEATIQIGDGGQTNTGAAATSNVPIREPRRNISLVNAVPVPDADALVVQTSQGGPFASAAFSRGAVSQDPATASGFLGLDVSNGDLPQMAIPMSGDEVEEEIVASKLSWFDWRLVCVVVILVMVISGLVTGLLLGQDDPADLTPLPTLRPTMAPTVAPTGAPTKEPTLQDGTPKPTTESIVVTPFPTVPPTIATIGTKPPSLSSA